MKLESELPSGMDPKVDGIIMFALINFPEIKVGDNIPGLILENVNQVGGFVDNDIVFIASKIVSKADNLIVDLREVEVSSKAIALSEESGKPAVVCQVILDHCPNVQLVNNGKTILAENPQSILCTSGGVDKLDEHHVTLLPDNPDLRANEIRQTLETESGKQLAVVIVDSDGLPEWKGAIAIPIGSSGISPIRTSETFDPILKKVKIQEENVIFMLANTAGFLLGQRGKGTPVVILRGTEIETSDNLGVSNAIHAKH